MEGYTRNSFQLTGQNYKMKGPDAPRILLETPHLLVIDKPAGISVERSPHGYPSVEERVINLLANRHRNPYLGIVHRLDRPVSGALLLAKKHSSLKKLNHQFSEGKVQKVYYALVESAPPEKAGVLSHFLGRSEDRKRAVVYEQKQKDTKPARLEYELEKEIPAGYLLKINPLQGRYHQIRAQLAHLGCPIKGDRLYGAKTNYQANAIALHAAQLTFLHPVNLRQIIVKAPVPFI